MAAGRPQGGWLISPLVGEMSGRTEGGAKDRGLAASSSAFPSTERANRRTGTDFIAFAKFSPLHAFFPSVSNGTRTRSGKFFPAFIPLPNASPKLAPSSARGSAGHDGDCAERGRASGRWLTWPSTRGRVRASRDYGPALQQFTARVDELYVVMRRTGLAAEPGDELGHAPPRLPQMPGYHLMRADRSGITMVNIGVGPANAKTITDHIAVLRPHAWLMLGHCAGLRTSQQLGDYVLAHAYVREDHVLDEELPLWVPIPALAEIQLALEDAVADVTGVAPAEVKRIMRTGTVASTDNRNWELLPDNKPQRRFSQSRAVALDMESATIAANGFRFRVPYGTLLCVSDKPLHGEIKLPGMANHFYRERVDQHLRIGIRAIDLLREGGPDQLHSRKLRSFSEVAFQ